MKKLILHIGSEKTGSTSIQNFLYSNKAALQSQGIYVPSFMEKQNSDLVISCLNEGKYDEYLLKHGIYNSFQREAYNKKVKRRVAKELSCLDNSIDKVIISSEHFHSKLTDKEEVKRLLSFMRDYFTDISVVFYVREQSSLVISSYSTIVKSGNVRINYITPNLETFIDQWCRKDNHFYNYKTVLDKWDAALEKGGIDVGIFNTKFLYKGCVVQDFINRLGINSKKLKIPNIRNESLTSFGVGVGRVVNMIFPAHSIYSPVRNVLFKFVNRVPLGEKLKINESKVKIIKEEFEESNNYISSKYLDGELSWYK